MQEVNTAENNRKCAENAKERRKPLLFQPSKNFAFPTDENETALRQSRFCFLCSFYPSTRNTPNTRVLTASMAKPLMAS